MLVETTPHLDVNRLNRSGSLINGTVSKWLLHPTTLPLTVTLRAEPSRLLVDLDGHGEVPPVLLARQPRHLGSEQLLFLCGCERPVYRLYIVRGPRLCCRTCAGLTYHCRRYRRRELCMLHRAAKLRARFGGVPGLRSPPPPKPRFVRKDYHQGWLAQLADVETKALAALAKANDALRKGIHDAEGHGTQAADEQRT